MEPNTSTKPKLYMFDGSNYAYWKNRIRMYLKFMNLDIWDIIQYGLFVSTKKEGERKVEKTREEYTMNERRKAPIDMKAMNALYNSLSSKEFNYI